MTNRTLDVFVMFENVEAGGGEKTVGDSIKTGQCSNKTADFRLNVAFPSCYKPAYQNHHNPEKVNYM